MTNFLLFSILFMLNLGIWLIYKKLSQIKKIREIGLEDMRHMKDIIIYLGRKDGFENDGGRYK